MLHIFRYLPLALFAAAAMAGPAQVHLAFGEDVPFVTTPDRVTEAMLDLAAVGRGDHVIDLGSGDGRIVIAAARRGARGLGVEIDPWLVAESIANAKKAGVADSARFLEQDLFRTDLSPATVVTLYLLPEVNLQLRPAILALRPGTRIVSHDWDMGDWQPDRSITLSVPEKTIGITKSSRVHLWIVPARIEGTWCGRHAGESAELRLRQSRQFAVGDIAIGGRPLGAVAGRLEGPRLSLEPVTDSRSGTLRLVAAEGLLKPAGAGGALSAAGSFTWRPARGASCARE